MINFFQISGSWVLCSGVFFMSIYTQHQCYNFSSTKNKKKETK